MIGVVMPPQIPILREFEDQSIVHYAVIVDGSLANMRNSNLKFENSEFPDFI